jgi:hypothetical protein
VVQAAVLFGLRNQEVASAKNVFLQVNDGAPQPQLLARLADVAKLKSVAECPHVESYGKLVPKPAAGDVVLRVWGVTLKSKTAATAWVGHFEGPQSGMACEEFFERTRSGWRRREPRANEGRACGVA